MVVSIRSQLVSQGIASSDPYSEEAVLNTRFNQRDGREVFNSLKPNAFQTYTKWKSLFTGEFKENCPVPAVIEKRFTARDGSIVESKKNVEINWVSIEAAAYYQHAIFLLNKKPVMECFTSAGSEFLITPQDLANLVEAQRANGYDLEISWNANSLAKIQMTKTVEVSIRHSAVS